MDWTKVVYLVATAFMWGLIGVNFWNLRKIRRLKKEWERMIEELEQAIAGFEAAQDKYFEWLNEESSGDLTNP